LMLDKQFRSFRHISENMKIIKILFNLI
jgi:hypothetical protein